MKLYTSDNSELMEVSALKTDDSNLIVSGTIMGAMPIEAVLTPAELRQSLKLLSAKTVWHIIKMLFKK
ncbi:MAG: hypothetical protein WDA24_05455 [Tissierellales bacterium]